MEGETGSISVNSFILCLTELNINLRAERREMCKVVFDSLRKRVCVLVATLNRNFCNCFERKNNDFSA